MFEISQAHIVKKGGWGEAHITAAITEKGAVKYFTLDVFILKSTPNKWHKMSRRYMIQNSKLIDYGNIALIME